MVAAVWAAAEALASTVTKEDLARKQLYPALPKVRDISAQVAAAVADVAYEKGKTHNSFACLWASSLCHAELPKKNENKIEQESKKTEWKRNKTRTSSVLAAVTGVDLSLKP